MTLVYPKAEHPEVVHLPTRFRPGVTILQFGASLLKPPLISFSSLLKSNYMPPAMPPPFIMRASCNMAPSWILYSERVLLSSSCFPAKISLYSFGGILSLS